MFVLQRRLKNKEIIRLDEERKKETEKRKEKEKQEEQLRQYFEKEKTEEEKMVWFSDFLRYKYFFCASEITVP